MSFVFAYFYDKCMQATEDACLNDWRKDLLSDLRGKVLEVGAGTGASLAHYPETAGLELYLAEPEPNMRAQLRKKVQAANKSNITLLSCAAESIDSEDAQFDYVFASLVCCSVADIDTALAEIKRVLKPGGSFVFLEHVAADQGSGRRKWQDRLNFLWKKVAGNCHLNRETETAILEAGFTIQEIKHESMRKAMPLVRPTIRGRAQKH